MTSINPLSALNNLGEATASKAAIANDFDTFLTLLTTQLQNQNPLEPLDTNQFTQQLVQFSEVEQSIKQNENLESLMKLQAANAITNTVGYIGKTVELTGTSQPLLNGEANWPINAGADASNTIFTVSDSDGNIVYTETTDLAQGESTFTWNGKTSSGTDAPEGNYTLKVSATNSEGLGVNVDIASSGLVEGVDMSGSNLYLIVGGQKIKLEEVTSIRQ
ncbi:MAG: flagellar hook assembly protein [Rhodomicrobium sp.]|nr:MAG: flagellar hook assembly protein [Rhodomicrobium sp.]